MDKFRGLYLNSIEKIVSNNTYRLKVQILIVAIIIMVLGTIMSIMNLTTKTYGLLVATSLLSFIGLLCFILTYKFNCTLVSSFIIGIFSGILAVYFLVSGGINGFSPFWICLFPFITYFLYEIKGGLISSLAMFLLIIIILWSPLSAYVIYDYSDSFYMRFPILYLGCSVSSWAFEFMRHNTYLKLKTIALELEKITTVDELTQIMNRRAFNIHLNKIWSDYQNSENYISLMMIDVDDFKNYNDHYGHLKGDVVLKYLALKISEIINEKGGCAYRWGGEEFAVILNLYDMKNSINIANEIILGISSLKIPHIFSSTNNKIISVSIGIATNLDSKSKTPEELIKCADKNLYAAKSSGKNCIFPLR